MPLWGTSILPAQTSATGGGCSENKLDFHAPVFRRTGCCKKIYSFFNSSKGSCMKNSTYFFFFSHLYAEGVQYCIQFLFRAPVNFLHLLLLVIIICYNLLLYIYLYYHVKNYKIVGTIIANLIMDKGWRLGFGAKKYIGNVFYADQTLRTSVP